MKTRPAQKLFVRVKLTGNPYRTRINVNGRHWKHANCKLCFLEPVYTGTRTRTRVYVNASLGELQQ